MHAALCKPQIIEDLHVHWLVYNKYTHKESHSTRTGTKKLLGVVLCCVVLSWQSASCSMEDTNHTDATFCINVNTTFCFTKVLLSYLATFISKHVVSMCLCEKGSSLSLAENYAKKNCSQTWLRFFWPAWCAIDKRLHNCFLGFMTEILRIWGRVLHRWKGISWYITHPQIPKSSVAKPKKENLQ